MVTPSPDWMGLFGLSLPCKLGELKSFFIFEPLSPVVTVRSAGSQAFLSPFLCHWWQQSLQWWSQLGDSGCPCPAPAQPGFCKT